MSSNLLGLPAENSSLRMTVFPVDFKVGITHPDRHSEFSSESSSFEKRLQPNYLSKKKRQSLSPFHINTQISQRSGLNSRQKKRRSNEGLISIEI